MLHWAERIITQISQKSFDRKNERPQQIHERSVGAIWTTQIKSTKSTTLTRSNGNCNNNNKAHPIVLHLSYPLRVTPISTTPTTTTTKRTDPTVFYLDKTTGFTMQNIEREETPD